MGYGDDERRPRKTGDWLGGLCVLIFCGLLGWLLVAALAGSFPPVR
jgi:hypothetical protein